MDDGIGEQTVSHSNYKGIHLLTEEDLCTKIKDLKNGTHLDHSMEGQPLLPSPQFRMPPPQHAAAAVSNAAATTCHAAAAVSYAAATTCHAAAAAAFNQSTNQTS